MEKLYNASLLESEKEELRKMVEGLVWYSPTKEELRRHGSGGVAIIDQWIASHAKFFIGKMQLAKGRATYIHGIVL